MLFFCLFQCFAEKEYQTVSKRNETFGRDLFWNKRNPGDLEWTLRSRRASHEAGGHALGGGRTPHLRGPLVSPLTDFLRLYILAYPENTEEHHETLIPPPQPSVPVRSHLGAISGAPPEGESIMEGFYINAKASPMSCE